MICHNINQYFQSPSTNFANNFIRWHLVWSLDSGHHQAMIQKYEHIQILKTTSWKSPLFTLKIHEKFILSTQRKSQLQKGPRDIKK
jgi:hypothetical protein